MMQTDELERQLRDALRDTLDRELGPAPAWSESPAARRVAELDRRRRWPLRVLGVAALIGAGGGAALLAGLPNQLPQAENGWIAYTVAQEETAGADGELDIWFVALGREPHRAIGTDSDSVDQLCPAFAPDGRSLAYGSVEGSGFGQIQAFEATYRNAALVIADVAADGTVSERLTIEVGDGLPPPCPVWSPEGDQLAFGVPTTSTINPTGSGQGSEVWVVTLADGGISVVPDLLATDLDWSPDGALLAIVGGVETASGGAVRDGLQDARIHLYAPSSDTIRSLDDTLGVTSVTWEPDGQRIAYAVHEGPAAGLGQVLRIIDMETGRSEVITPAFDSIHGIGPVWSPDGDRIVYQRMVRPDSERHEVVLVTPDDRSAETGIAREVVIAPDDTGLGLFPWRVSWSADSTYLLYRAWSYAGGGEVGVEQQSLVAVPTDPDGTAVVLAEMGGMVAYDSPDTMRVPFQIWAPGPVAGSDTGVAAIPSAPSSEPTSSRGTSATADPSTRGGPPSPATELVVGGDRPVTLHLPSAGSETPAPLIILLHGYGGNAAEMEDLLPLGRVAAARGVLVAAPEGTVDRDGNRFWNATDVCCDWGDTGVDDAGYLAVVIDEIQSLANVDPKRIYVVGYSNGGFMSYRMACEHAGLVAAVVSLSGASFADSDHCRPSEPVAALQIHGTADDFVRFDGGELSEAGAASTYPGARDSARAWAAYDGCALELVETAEMVDVDALISGPSGPAEASVARATDCEPGGHAELWTIPDGSHFPNLSGTFAETLVDFLLAHPKP